MSRLRILLLFAALAGLATVFAACGGGSGSSDENPKTVLEDSTFEGIENADVDLKLGVEVSGDEGGNVDVNLSGPFQSKGKNQLPELDMTASAKGSVNGKNVDFEGGLVLVPNKAYVSYEGTDYEVDSTTFSFIESAIEQAQTESGARGRHRGRHGVPGSRRGQVQRRRIRRKPDQRRLGRRRRDQHDEGQRRPRHRRGAGSGDQADRNPRLQLAARIRRPAAAERTRRRAGRNEKR